MKKILLVLALLLSMTSNVFAQTEEERYEENKKMVQDMLDGFYGVKYPYYEINYGLSEIDRKDEYRKITITWYVLGDYERILRYNVENDITVVFDIYAASILESRHCIFGFNQIYSDWRS